MIEMLIACHHHPVWTKIASTAFVAASMAVLCTGQPIIAVALALYGAGLGLESIARGTLPLALFGSAGYAALLGKLATPSLIDQASAPWIGAVLIEEIGSEAMLRVLLAAAGANVLIVLTLFRLMRTPHAKAV